MKNLYNLYKKAVVIILTISMVMSAGVFAFALEASDNTTTGIDSISTEDSVSDVTSSDTEDDETPTNDEITIDDETQTNSAEDEEPEPSDDNAQLMESENITVHYNHLEGEIEGTYDDSFFTGSNDFNLDLARFSLLTAMASFDTGSGTHDENIRELYNNIGFNKNGKYYASYGYDSNTDTSDNAACAIAYKNINGENVLSVAIRSSGYGYEWGSNARVYSSSNPDEHYGFANSADNVYATVKEYINEKQAQSLIAGNGNIDKIWITGYSRGAAVANVLGQRMGKAGDVVSADNIYCYTFETPTTTTKTETDKTADGVYNIISTSDVIPQLPFYYWGYGRYGTDKYVISSKVSLKKYRDNIDAAKKEFKQLTKTTYKPQTVWAENITLDSLNSVVGGDIHSYASNWQTKLILILSVSLGKTGGTASSIKSVANKLGTIDYLTGHGVDTITLMQQHYPEALLAWMDNLNSKKSQSSESYSRYLANSCNYKYVTITCRESGDKTYANCNIEVKNSSGTTVATVKDDGKINDGLDTDFSLEVNKDDNGDIQILVPSDYKYSLTLTTSANVTVDYQITEYINCVASRLLRYKNVAVNNTTMTAESPKGIDIESSNYTPSVDGEKHTDAVPITGSNLRAVKPNVTINGNGYVTGIKEYPRDTDVTLTAQGDNFFGWFVNGNYIGSSTSYSFNTSSNPSIEAVFNPSISNCNIKVENRCYNGRASNPGINVSYRGVKLVAGRDYTVKYSGNRYIGNYSAVVSGTGKFKGSISKSYSIMPYGTKLKKVSKSKKAFTAKWAKQKSKMPKSRIGGYQIQYSKKSNFAGARIKTVKKYSKTSGKVSKLSRKTIYYVRVRTYMKTGTGTCYSPWSNVRTVRTK